MIQILTIEFNPFPVNCYVLFDQTKEGVIIDPGCYTVQEMEELRSTIEQKGIRPKHLLNTHLHLDHVFGNPFVERTYSLVTEAHREDEFLLPRMKNHAAAFGMTIPEDPSPIGKYLEDGEKITFGDSILEAIHIPGHSPGSLAFYCEKEGIVFTGDVLFQGSIGRTDLIKGDYDLLIQGIRHRLLTLPDSTKVYPGHGPSTTIQKEIENNPFI